MIIKLVGAINDLLWGDLIILEFSGGEVQFGLSLLVLILIPAGLYFTFKTKFLPFRLFPEMIRVTLEKDEAKKAGKKAFGHSVDKNQDSLDKKRLCFL